MTSTQNHIVSRNRKAKNLLLAIHPAKIPATNLRFTHTFGLGGMALVIILLQVFTGILLRFHYDATPAGAYQSIRFIENNIVFGQLFRNIHYWSGMFLIVISFLHLLRVFLSGAFLPPRHWNWMIGIGLFLLVVLMNFTGYLLPWDQLSYWAVTVSTSMFDYVPFVGQPIKELIRGGAETADKTLTNFYIFHTAILPGLITLLLVWHFWKVRKNGGVILPRKTNSEDLKLTDTYPHLVNREIIAALALLAFILLFSLLFDATLQEKANPAFSPNPAKSPWYFQGIQELLLHFHPVFAVLILPMILMAGFTLFPFLNYKNEAKKIDFTPNIFKPIVFWSALTGIVVTPVLVLLDDYVLHFQQHDTDIPSWISEGIFPLIFLAGLTWVFVIFIQRKFSKKRIDIVLSLFILFSTAYILLTLIGTFFRGEGMQLIWP